MGIISMNSATNHHLSNRAKNCSLLASLALSATALLFSNNFAYAEASSSSASANASVTVSDTIRLTLTGGDLVINNLIPGVSADSNIITATVTSNSPYGFHLSATTGTKNGTTSLINTADSNFSFTNLNTNKATLNDFSDNTWGYSYSTDNGTNWVSGDYGTTQSGYNGLSLDSDDSGAAAGTTLFNSDTYTNSTAVKFKIGAKSSQTQVSGTYTGTVNFYAVTNPGPKTIANATTMQEVEACPASIPMETVYTLTDSRDNQTYKVARLKDGKCWMLENLNLAGGSALDADKTDVTSAYISSFSTSNNLTKTGDTIVLPASSTSGFNTNNYSYVYNSGNKTSNCANPGCYSYYSWDAATLGSGRSISTGNTDAEQSICPKGWRLPTSGATSNNGWKRGDFYKLATAYGANLESDSKESSSTFYNNAGPGTVPGFLLAGYYINGSFIDGGSYGGYWSSTSLSGTSYVLDLDFNSSLVNSADGSSRSLGFSVRCLLKAE